MGLSLQTVTLPKERSYFNIIAIISILVWLTVAVTIVGLFYAAVFALFAWLGNGLLIAYLRSECVKVSETQLPDLHANFLRVCQRLELNQVPELYVLQAGGTLNAFATRFSKRNFVVVFSDTVEAFGQDSKEMSFLLGHEIGHLKSGHIGKRIFAAPGMLIPLLGSAYFRACEASCDRHGAYAADDLASSERALLVLGGGKVAGHKLDALSFLSQHETARGFFVSWHELSSPYPTLSQRVWLLRSLAEPRAATKRDPLAFLFALLTPNTTMTGSGNILVVVVLIGLLSAMAIPAFTKVRENAELKTCYNNQRMLQGAYQQYYLTNNQSSTDVALLEKTYIGGKPLHCSRGSEYTIEVLDDGDCDIECSVHGKLLKR